MSTRRTSARSGPQASRYLSMAWPAVSGRSETSNRAHRASSALRGGEVGAGVARLEVGRAARAVDEQRDEQQHGVVGGGSDDDAERTHRTGEVAAGASAAQAGDAGDQQGRESGADGEQCRG
ncbi:hypothetical protein [Lentzea californiensis]|uniref:hypothetical protein n=1 Tax=Lentzea californiensis TaxID=438851 RepID=UPI0027D9FDFB|nr:hypothetical protein [Lentzea californiensis]